jgi:serine/threonine protein kinase
MNVYIPFFFKCNQKHEEYECNIKNIIHDEGLFISLMKIIKNMHSNEDLTKILNLIKLNNGNIFSKYDTILNVQQFDEVLFESHLTKISCCSKKNYNLALKIKKKICFDTIENFIGEVIIGQYLNYFAPDYVNSCVQYLDSSTYVIQFNRLIDGIEWSNTNLQICGKTIKVIRNLCNTILTIHDLGVIHNDLKLDNILIDESTLNVKIIDFDTSSFNNTSHLFTRNVGTIVYMCPMVLCSKLNIKRSKYTDLYCLIVCIFYMLSESNIQFDEGLLLSDIMSMGPKRIKSLNLKRIKLVELYLKGRVSDNLIKYMVKLMNIDVLLANKHLTSNEYIYKLKGMINSDNIYIYKDHKNVYKEIK